MRLIAVGLAVLALAGCRSTKQLKAVDNFDSEKYCGTWYEAARLPHRFEKNMSSVSANYTIYKDGVIKVINKGYNDKKQEWETIEGRAFPNEDPTLGLLKVSFFGPFKATYKILYLDEDYTKAVVTGPSFNYLWLLVRDPAMQLTEWEYMVDEAKAFGFETDKLIYVDQSKNIE